jgi:pyridoxine 5-phosphate synthase
MVRLSVNVNKIATLRNSRTSQPRDRSAGSPSVVEAARVCMDAGAPGITVHPRLDARHITAADVHELAAELAAWPEVEFNIEGDPRPDLLALAHEVRPAQLTLVPVRPGEVTSQAGWDAATPATALQAVVKDAQVAGMRVSLFIDPTPEAVRWARQMGADRVELFTEPFAQAFARDPQAGRRSFDGYAAVAQLAHELGLGVNAGHDLGKANLVVFRELPHLDEVSIGHALIADALDRGLAASVQAYLSVLSASPDRDAAERAAPTGV